MLHVTGVYCQSDGLQVKQQVTESKYNNTVHWFHAIAGFSAASEQTGVRGFALQVPHQSTQ